MKTIINDFKEYLLRKDVAKTNSNAFHSKEGDISFDSFLPSYYSEQHGIEHNIVIKKDDTKLLEIFVSVMEVNDKITLIANFQRNVSSNVGYFLEDFNHWQETEELSILSSNIIKALNLMLVSVEDDLKKHFKSINDVIKKQNKDEEAKLGKKAVILKKENLALISYPLGDELFDILINKGGLALSRYNSQKETIQTEQLRVSENKLDNTFFWTHEDGEVTITAEKAKRLIYSAYYDKDVVRQSKADYHKQKQTK